MTGFFTNKEIQSESRPNGKFLGCTSCQLYKGAQHPKMKPFGKFEKGILIIGEAPGKVEDERGKPWQGKTGRLLKVTLRRMGIDLFNDCLLVNAVNCRPEKNKTPSPFQVRCCYNVIVNDVIKKYQPSLIILLGASAVQSVIGHTWKDTGKSILKWRGACIPDQTLKTWICPTFHPSFILRGEDKEMLIWKQDLERALAHLNEPVPVYKRPKIKFIKSLDVLKTIKTDLVAFDYETTGLKPYSGKHKIISASIAVNPDLVYVFMMPRSKEKQEPFLNILRDLGIAKMAHNMKFEDVWSNVILKTPVNNWTFDSMQAAHVLDNRPGITSLKFQTYINFGQPDYSSEIEPYLKAKDSNSLNSIEKLIEMEGGKKKLLIYNAWDSINEFRLAMKQINYMDYSYLPF